MDEPAVAQSLIDSGLNTKSASLYLTLLGARRMTIAELARVSGIKRATCYEHLDQLLFHDFVTRIPVGKRMFYAANDPRKIVGVFKKKLASLESNIEQLQRIRNEAVHRPRVVFYEGKREIRNIYNELFRTIGDTYSIFPADSFFQSFTAEDYDEFDKEISKHALKSHDLFLADKHYRRIKEIRAKNGGANKHDKRLPKDFQSNVDVLIYSDKVALVSLRDLSGIVIENPDIAQLFKSIHKLIWRSI